MADTATAANGTVPPPPEEIANAIVEIAEGMKALNKTRLTRRAITLLMARVQGRVASDKVADFYIKFGDNEKTREQKIVEFVSGATQTAGRDAIVQHDAYDVFASQDDIQTLMTDRLKDFLSTQMMCELISVTLIDKPTFDNQDIEDAASKVVAAQKLKQAAEQYKLAAQTTLEKNQIENQIYTSSPQAFELRKLEYQKEIAQAWSGHQGTLVFGGNSQLQVPAGGGK